MAQKISDRHPPKCKGCSNHGFDSNSNCELEECRCLKAHGYKQGSMVSYINVGFLFQIFNDAYGIEVCIRVTAGLRHIFRCLFSSRTRISCHITSVSLISSGKFKFIREFQKVTSLLNHQTKRIYKAAPEKGP